MSIARVYAHANSQQPEEYWAYEKIDIEWSEAAPYAVLLFGGRVEPRPLQGSIVVDGWVSFAAHAPGLAEGVWTPPDPRLFS